MRGRHALAFLGLHDVIAGSSGYQRSDYHRNTDHIHGIPPAKLERSVRRFADRDRRPAAFTAMNDAIAYAGGLHYHLANGT